MSPHLTGWERIVGIVLDLILCSAVGVNGVTALDLFPLFVEPLFVVSALVKVFLVE